MNTCNVSVVIPTYNRPDQLLEAIEQILECDPKPKEIIVHIDAGDNVTEQAIHRSTFQNIIILKSTTQMGPGGGRNKAIAHAKYPIVASFDDDSYPLDKDYFDRLLHLFAVFPKAAVIGAAIYHKDESVSPDEKTAQWESAFVGCGCAYRKEAFQQTNGYVALPVAYGMEEVDLALRLHAMDWGILTSPWLRVFHNTRLEHHSSPKVTAASIANLALLAYLRYPPSLWWLGLMQCLNRVVWLVRHGRWAGIGKGIMIIPMHLWQHQQHRQPIASQSLFSYLKLRRSFIQESLPQATAQ
jgi:GT2 family glycosyltransferase